MIFTEKMALSYDRWLDTPAGRYMDRREKSLITELLEINQGDRILDVGCGTGEHLLFFREKGCSVTGLEPSSAMRKLAQEKMGRGAVLYGGVAEDLPFSDDEFDIVSIITTLEFVDDPEKAISEAIRVCRGRVFIGALNSCSFMGAQRKLTSLFSPSVYSEARFFNIIELLGIIKKYSSGAPTTWGSVLSLPEAWYDFAAGIDEYFPVYKNPLGAFLGISFPVSFTYRTIQEPLREEFRLTAKNGAPVQGAIRGGEK